LWGNASFIEKEVKKMELGELEGGKKAGTTRDAMSRKNYPYLIEVGGKDL